MRQTHLELRDLLLASLALCAVVALFLSRVQPAPVPPEMQRLMGSKPSRIWVGNSVAQRAIDPAHLPAGEVRLALDGSELAHWVAALERLNLQDTQVVVYASTVHLGELELKATRDRELFWALAPADGGSARPWAVDQPPWMGPILQERGRQRDRLLRWAARGPATALWGPEAGALLDQALSRTPVLSTAMSGRGEQQRAMPDRIPQGAVSDLVRAAGGELVWVLPFQRKASPCWVHPLNQELSEQPGVRVIDLSSRQLPQSWFGSEMHLLAFAQRDVTTGLVHVLAEDEQKTLVQVCSE